MDDNEIFAEIFEWTTYATTIGNDFYDCISYITNTNKILIEWKFKRVRNFIYLDALKDSASVYCKDINYLNNLQLFYENASDKYVISTNQQNWRN